MNNGLFITLEGGEGAGKSTQALVLKHYFESQGREVILTREPGGTIEAEKIRNLIVDRDGGNWSAFEETLLLFTARHHHLRQKIMPSLSTGAVVICDRFTDSTIAYQGYGHGMDLKKIDAIKQLTIGDFNPHLTFLFDIEPAIGLARSQKRLKSTGTTEDRFENLDLTFHETLRAGYLQLARKNPDRFIIINAKQTPESIAELLINHLQDRGF